MKITFPDFKKAHVLVVGDVMLDRYWYGSTDRISPEAPVPVIKIEKKEERPGGAANVAMNIATLGANIHLIGLIGIDDTGKILINKLNEANVCCDLITLSSYPTITKLRILSYNQQLIRIDFEKKNDNFSMNLLLERIQKKLPYIKVLVLSDYDKGTLRNIANIIKLANTAQVPILIDPKGSNYKNYYGATLLTPNMTEFEAMVGICSSNIDIERKGTKLLYELNLQALLITRSEKGMTLLQRNKSPLHLSTQAKEVYDVTGAGDTVIGVLATALAVSLNFYQASILANVAAGIVVGKLGTSTISSLELEKKIQNDDNKFGVISEKDLKKVVSIARKNGKKIVMTNGCFDILHAGHVMYLSNARKLGDLLIVAVNSDESVKNLKGINRPINILSQRMMVLGGLNAVDWVVSFDEETPQRLIGNILPDILVKGGDYKIEEISGSQEVLASGGEVKILNFEYGVSTTKIISTFFNNN
ncbi:bifunctional D-glycero-beta-D-manno-heptose-7-phosphate kinase/D-glycero-beta-D-manno-heptose 1-phosphate adenylyltransferase HldE [Arsenophonus symbiont of Ornithomya chloropus]|uniref:bifunctional D-glycero-beta-D-manno-heptose-7-phosphate kinase/D-glycero-beta-D-manno-heptose 1-phosphate adenylyltransferase HldE n=1 Tax=Arsenophonus symbiont of Ornithomya chloropus TaxID=634121 RepID=UPI0032B15D93